MILAGGNSTHPDVAEALRECRRAFASVALFSGVVNLLMLAGPLYMLQIYDRVLSSRSVPTLIALSIFLVGAYAFQGALDLIRSRVVVRSAAVLDQRLALAVHGAVIRLAVATPAPRRRAPAGPRPRSDPRLSDRRGPDRHRRFALGPGVPDHLFPHSSLARRGVDGGRHHPVHDDPADRARQPRPGARGRAGRGQASDHGGGATPRRRDHHGDGNGRGAGAALGGGQQPLYRGRRQLERRRRRLRQRIEGAAAPAAVGDPRAGRLSRDPPGDDRRRHGRRLDHDGPRARSDRNRHRQLARLHLRAPEHHPAVGGAHARRAEAGGHRAAAAGPQSRRRAARRSSRRGARSRSSPTCTSRSRPARRWASSVRAAPARPRWCAPSWASGGRPKVACGSMAPRSTNGIRSCSASMSASSRRRSSCSTAPSPRTSPG